MSHANPRRATLGTAELYDWVSLEGIPIRVVI